MNKKLIIVLGAVAVLVGIIYATRGVTLSGEYYSGDKSNTMSYTSYVFSGDKVTYSEYLAGHQFDSYEGEYVIKDGNIIITWTDSKGETKTKTQTFSRLDDGSVRIGVGTYKKAVD